MSEKDLRQKMLPVLDSGVESGAITRDEAFAVLDLVAPNEDYAERVFRAYWQQRTEGRGMSDTAWIPDTEVERMLTALHKASR